MIDNKRIKSSQFALFYTFFVILGTFTLIHGWFPQLHRLVFLCFGIVAITVLTAPKFFLSKEFIMIMIYSGVVYMNFLMGDKFTEGKEVLDGLTLASCGAMAFYYAKSDDQKHKIQLFWASFIIILIDLIGTLTLYIINPEIVRFVQSMANGGDNTSTLEFYKYGLVEYDMLHGFPVLIPPLIMWIRDDKTKRIWKIIGYLCLGILVILLYIGDATTPFLLSLIAIVFSFLIVKNSHKRRVRRLLVIGAVAVPILMFGDSLINGTLDVAYNVTDGELQKKIDDFRQMRKSGEMEGDVDVRYNLYESSVDAFWGSPLIGTNDLDSLGGHSAFFDRLGAFGLLGTIPWVLVFVWLTRFNYKFLQHKARDYYLVGVFCFAALLLLKNMSYFYTWYTFVVLLPCMLTLNVENK